MAESLGSVRIRQLNDAYKLANYDKIVASNARLHNDKLLLTNELANQRKTVENLRNRLETAIIGGGSPD